MWFRLPSLQCHWKRPLTLHLTFHVTWHAPPERCNYTLGRHSLQGLKRLEGCAAGSRGVSSYVVSWDTFPAEGEIKLYLWCYHKSWSSFLCGPTGKSYSSLCWEQKWPRRHHSYSWMCQQTTILRQQTDEGWNLWKGTLGNVFFTNQQSHIKWMPSTLLRMTLLSPLILISAGHERRAAGSGVSHLWRHTHSAGWSYHWGACPSCPLVQHTQHLTLWHWCSLTTS